MENTYTLFWLTGRSEIISGTTPEGAMTNAGYSSGAIRALDFYATGDKRADWVWDSERRDWYPVSLANSH